MLKSLYNFLLFLAVCVTTLTLTSCDDSFIFDNEGDCHNTYRIRFVYNMNLKWADAFPSEVHSVNLYLFDEEGLFVREFDAAGEALSKPGFCIEFDDQTITPGDYTFIAWCGFQNDTKADEESFIVPTPVPGVTTMEELTCSLKTYSNDQYPEYSDRRLNFLYHGMMKANLPDTRNGDTFDYTIYLTKDTNHIRVVLQEMSGDDMNEKDYEMKIEAADGILAYNNDLLPNNPKLDYLPWSITKDKLALTAENGVTKYNYGVVADFTTSRMVIEHENEFYLTIYKKGTGETLIARIPIIQYALLSKDYFSMVYDRPMTNQEFLDREEEYTLTFFLYNNRWMDAYIDINSWRLVLHEYGAGDNNN